MPANVSTHWAVTTFSGGNAGNIIVQVNGVNLPVSQFSMNYGLNAIPMATAMLAIGRDARTQQKSVVYDSVKDLKQMTPVVVKLVGSPGDWAPQGDQGVKEQWPAGEHILFTGYTAGISYRRSSGVAVIVLNMIGKLLDLTMSSGGSVDVVPAAPNDLMLPLLLESSGAAPAGTAAYRFTENLTDGMTIDFSNALLAMLADVARDNQLQVHEAWCNEAILPAVGEKGGLRDNTRALEALTGDGVSWEGMHNLAAEGAYSKYVEPYSLLVSESSKAAASAKISDELAASFAGSSFWGLLIGSILPAFGMGLIPVSTSAIVAPVLPMPESYVLTVNPQEYVDFNMKMPANRVLYGVGIMTSSISVSSAKSNVKNKLCVGATYVGPDVGEKGAWLFAKAPSWAEDWINHDPAARNGDADVVKLLNTTSHDAAGIDDTAVARDAGSEVDGWNDALNKYARMLYASSALDGRSGTLVGKLRFDISPGTTIRIKAKVDKDNAADGLATDMVGFVARVTIAINAEQGSAVTTLELTNLRTIDENTGTVAKDSRFSMSDHPFFGNAYFKYAPLVASLVKA